MNLFIKLENGQPINHPMFEDNILQCYPDIDLNNTELFKPFIRLPIPSPVDMPRTDLQTIESVYILSDDGACYTDSYYLRDLTPEEAEALMQEKIKVITDTLQALTDMAEHNFLNADGNDRDIWSEYLKELASFTYSNALNAILPAAPAKDKNGNWLMTTQSGKKPNVIG